MPFQLALLLTFPREVFYIAPPVPLDLAEGPQITSEIGRVAFYFDRWEVRYPTTTAATFFAHFIPSAFPPELDLALTTDGHQYAFALYSWESPEEKELSHFLWSTEQNETPEHLAERQGAEAKLQDLRLEHIKHVDQVCDHLFADPVLGHYLKKVGDYIIALCISNQYDSWWRG
jgi:hypothetical protein